MARDLRDRGYGLAARDGGDIIAQGTFSIASKMEAVSAADIGHEFEFDTRNEYFADCQNGTMHYCITIMKLKYN